MLLFKKFISYHILSGTTYLEFEVKKLPSVIADVHTFFMFKRHFRDHKNNHLRQIVIGHKLNTKEKNNENDDVTYN